MSDYTTKSFGSSVLVWPTTNGPRDYVYGLCMSRSNKFTRTPYLRAVGFTSGGSVVRRMPITAVFRMNIMNLAPINIHPIVDDKSGFAAYGLNILGSTIDETALSALPSVSVEYTGQSLNKSVRNAVAWFNIGNSILYVMPSTLTTNKLKGPLYDRFDSYFHVRNGCGLVSSSGTRVASVDGKFPFYTMDSHWADAANFPGRTDILVRPSIFAVVHCVNCVPTGVGMTRIRSRVNPINSTSTYPVPELKQNSNNEVQFFIKDTNAAGYSSGFEAVEIDTDGITRVKEIWMNATSPNEKVYFVWCSPGFSETIEADAYLYSFYSAPYVGVTPTAVAGQTATARILQYGVEFNF